MLIKTFSSAPGAPVKRFSSRALFSLTKYFTRNVPFQNGFSFWQVSVSLKKSSLYIKSPAFKLCFHSSGELVFLRCFLFSARFWAKAWYKASKFPRKVSAKPGILDWRAACKRYASTAKRGCLLKVITNGLSLIDRMQETLWAKTTAGIHCVQSLHPWRRWVLNPTSSNLFLISAWEFIWGWKLDVCMVRTLQILNNSCMRFARNDCARSEIKFGTNPCLK